MTFSRSFKSQTWFVQLPVTHTIESISGDVVVRAFLAGTLRPSTPIRSVGGHVWTTLADAAGFENEERMSLTNMVDASTTSLEPVAEAWQVGKVDARAFRPRLGRVGAALGCVAGIGMAVLATLQVSGEITSKTQRVSAAHAIAVAPTLLPAPEEPAPIALAPAPRLSQKDIERLKQMDLVRKWSKPRTVQTTSRTSLQPPSRQTRVAIENGRTSMTRSGAL